ncbi:MAG: hypothetical protein ABS880_10680, partial [Psychrobacter alimentarius]
YAKAPSESSTPIDVVEWFAKNKGITNLDDPSVKVRTIINDVNESELARQEARKARESAAQDAFLDAMFNLSNGTAVLRQKSERTKPAKKVVPVKQLKVAKAAKKPAKPTVKKERKPYYHKPDRLVPSSQVQARARRKMILEKLQAGEFVPMQPKQTKKGDLDLYQQQRAAIKKLEKQQGLTIVRIKRISDNQSFWALDNFKRHQIDRAITGRLDDADRIPLITAITSNELVLASDIKSGTRIGVSSTTILARNHGMNIYTVFSGKYVLGWILIDESEKPTPAPILEAAYREFKRVAKDAGTTINGVLAVKGRQ